MGIGASQLLGSLIHELRKGCLGSGNLFCQPVRHLAGGLQQQGVKGIPHAEGISRIQLHRRRPGLQSMGGSFRIGHGIVKAAVFRHQQRGHQLRHGSRIHLLIGVLVKQDLSCGRVVKYRRLRAYAGLLDAFVDGDLGCSGSCGAGGCCSSGNGAASRRCFRRSRTGLRRGLLLSADDDAAAAGRGSFRSGPRKAACSRACIHIFIGVPAVGADSHIAVVPHFLGSFRSDAGDVVSFRSGDLRLGGSYNLIRISCLGGKQGCRKAQGE